jgi:hypothetical protein
MDLFLAICQGAGLATAAGIRPFLPALLAGALASGDKGLDFEGTDYRFLERPGFLLAVVVVFFGVVLLDRWRGAGTSERGPVGAALGGVSIGIGALLFAGSLTDLGHPAWPGLAGGVVCAAIGQTAARGILSGARARLDAAAAAALGVYADGASLVLAAVAVLAPPLALVGLAGLAVLAVRSHGRGDRKYAGLRVLR